MSHNALSSGSGDEEQSSRGVALEVSGMTVSYDAEPVVEDFSFDVSFGRLVGIVGPNGAGKSTMIKAVVGALPMDAGSVTIAGETGRRAVKRVTYVPQRGSVDWDFPVTVRDVVGQGRYGELGLFSRFRKKDRDAVSEALERVGMTEFATRQIGELSGGQQQRVFLARALAHDGDVFLMDEPFVGVDAATEAAIVEVLRELKARGKAVMVVHHDLSTVREYFDEVLLMDRVLIIHDCVEVAFTREHLQRTYGGKLTVLGDGDVAVVGRR